MGDRMEERNSSPVVPCCSPFHSQTEAVLHCKDCMEDAANHGVGSHDVEHGGKWLVEQGDHYYREQMIEF